MPERFTVVKKGYDISEVNEYIETLENVIKGYKEKDAAIKNAILNAQIAADNIIQNAKNRSYEMKESATARIKDIIASMDTQRKKLDNFKAEYNNIISKYLHDINNNDIAAISDKIDSLEEYLRRFTDDEPANAAPSQPQAAAPAGVAVSDEEKRALNGMFNS